MLNKCTVSINNNTYRSLSVEGVAEILKGNELNIYVENSRNSDSEDLVMYFFNNVEEHPSIRLDSDRFTIICWDCYIKSSLFKRSKNGEDAFYSTLDGSMIKIGCQTWIDYPFKRRGIDIPFDQFILERGFIDLRNLGNWNTINNDGKYTIDIDYDGINFSITRKVVPIISTPQGEENPTPRLHCKFFNNKKYRLPELISQFAFLRDFLSFITGKYIQMEDVEDYIDDTYDVIFHVNLAAYYPAIEESKPWGINNITLDELECLDMSELFRKWQDVYSGNSYPLSFFNRTDRKRMSEKQYIAEAIIAFDSLSEIMTDQDYKKGNRNAYRDLKKEIYNCFKDRFDNLELTDDNINIGMRPDTLKNRILDAIKRLDIHLELGVNYVQVDDNAVAEVLKNIRVSAAHGTEVKPSAIIKPYHYSALSLFCEKLLIRYIRKMVFEL